MYETGNELYNYYDKTIMSDTTLFDFPLYVSGLAKGPSLKLSTSAEELGNYFQG